MKTLIGVKNGMGVWASDTLLAQVGERQIKRSLGIARRFPVVTDMSGKVVMVEADSWEEAIELYCGKKLVRPGGLNGTDASGRALRHGDEVG